LPLKFCTFTLPECLLHILLSYDMHVCLSLLFFEILHAEITQSSKGEDAVGGSVCS